MQENRLQRVEQRISVGYNFIEGEVGGMDASHHEKESFIYMPREQAEKPHRRTYV
jgi:hypothetical protein